MFKKVLILILIICTLICCQKKVEKIKNRERSLPSKEMRKLGKAFFDFDKVEHYFISIEENEAMDLTVKNTPTQKEKALSDILANFNMNFTDNLVEYHFTKTVLDNSKLDAINNIFSTNKCETTNAYSCIPVFRDIFIFKKNEKVVGKAKICFGCRLYYIEGSKENTADFGQCGDFEKLEKLLK